MFDMSWFGYGSIVLMVGLALVGVALCAFPADPVTHWDGEWYAEGAGELEAGLEWAGVWNQCKERAVNIGGYSGRCDLKDHDPEKFCCLERGMERVRFRREREGSGGRGAAEGNGGG